MSILLPTPVNPGMSQKEGMYRGLALAQLSILRDQLKQGNLVMGTRAIQLENGTVIDCKIIYNYEEILVTIPPAVLESPTTPRKKKYVYISCIPRSGELQHTPMWYGSKEEVDYTPGISGVGWIKYTNESGQVAYKYSTYIRENLFPDQASRDLFLIGTEYNYIDSIPEIKSEAFFSDTILVGNLNWIGYPKKYICLSCDFTSTFETSVPKFCPVCDGLTQEIVYVVSWKGPKSRHFRDKYMSIDSIYGNFIFENGLAIAAPSHNNSPVNLVLSAAKPFGILVVLVQHRYDPSGTALGLWKFTDSWKLLHLENSGSLFTWFADNTGLLFANTDGSQIAINTALTSATYTATTLDQGTGSITHYSTPDDDVMVATGAYTGNYFYEYLAQRLGLPYTSLNHSTIVFSENSKSAMKSTTNTSNESVPVKAKCTPLDKVVTKIEGPSQASVGSVYTAVANTGVCKWEWTAPFQYKEVTESGSSIVVTNLGSACGSSTINANGDHKCLGDSATKKLKFPVGTFVFDHSVGTQIPYCTDYGMPGIAYLTVEPKGTDESGAFYRYMVWYITGYICEGDAGGLTVDGVDESTGNTMSFPSYNPVSTIPGSSCNPGCYSAYSIVPGSGGWGACGVCGSCVGCANPRAFRSTYYYEVYVWVCP